MKIKTLNYALTSRRTVTARRGDTRTRLRVIGVRDNHLVVITPDGREQIL